MELPLYTVYVETPRFIFPKILKIIFLCLFFYIVVWIDFLFLQKQMPFYLIIIAVIVIILIVLLSTIYNYSKFSNHNYKFFMNRIEYSGDIHNSIMYNQIQTIKIKKDLFDMLFKTGTIDLESFKIRAIPNLNQVFFYVQKMVQTYGTSQGNSQYPNNSVQGNYSVQPDYNQQRYNYQNRNY